MVPHGAEVHSWPRMKENTYRRRVSRRYFCSLVLKMSPSDLIQAAIRQRSGSHQAAIRKRSGSDQPENPPASRGRAVAATPLSAHPPTIPQPQGGRAATAGGSKAGRPPRGAGCQPCRYTRPLSRPLHSRKSVIRPLSRAGLPPLLYSPLRRLLTPPAATPPLRGGRAVARSARSLPPPASPPRGGRHIENIGHLIYFNVI